MIEIREAMEADVPAIREIFTATYGGDYVHPEIYEDRELKRLVFDEDTVVLVAENAESGRVVGTASVVLDVGAYSDLVGEFGRLAVLPEARGRGVGKLLMEGRIARVRDRLHVGYVEARVTHPYSLRISHRFGFAPVGFAPMRHQFGPRRESFALLVQHFGDALELRRNHPRIVPETYELAGIAMDNVGIPYDAIVDEESPAYPHGGDFEVEELDTEGYPALLRIERGRVRQREVFGPLRLHYGFFKLRAAKSTYLIARRDGRIIGAVGFTHDVWNRAVRIFELINLDDGVIRVLLQELERRCLEDWDVINVEVDVRADAPAMQRTLLEFGFVPVAYMPSFVFQRVERLDAIRMMRLLKPLELGEIALVSPTRQVAEQVLRALARREVLPRISQVVDEVDLFRGLSDEQIQRLAGICGHAEFRDGERIFAADDACDRMYLVIRGEVAIRLSGEAEPVGHVRGGECVGEVALLTGAAHSATAVAVGDVEAGMLRADDLTRLIRQRPDIGVVLYRNLAGEIGDKLRRADRVASTS